MGGARQEALRLSSDGSRFATLLGLTTLDERRVAATIDHMANEQKCRGMFFGGVLHVLGAKGSRAKAALEELGINSPRVPFGLYPHRDFYKLCFWAATHLYPNSDLDSGMYQLAASFYPIFKESLLGRTMAPLMGSRPFQVLSRLVDAYRLCVPMNEHELQRVGACNAEWVCKVEPTDFYPHIFRGIVMGTMSSQGVPAPEVTLKSRNELPYGHAHVFSISWQE